MSINELKKKFEQVLQDFLKKNLVVPSNIKILKNQIKIKVTKDNNSTGNIYFHYISSSFGYMLGTSVNSLELNEFYRKVNPPYKRNMSDDVVYVMNSLGEESRNFSSSISGVVLLPNSDLGRQQICEWIKAKVQKIYLPRMINIAELKAEAVNDVLTFPEYYSYPFLTILYLVKKNNIPLDSLNMELILNKRIIGDELFDKQLLRELF